MRVPSLSNSQTTALEADAPRMNRRQAAKVRTRQKVLDAARGLFAERGYDAATIRDIAKGAGMSTGAVFANFQDKNELFEAVLTEDMANMLTDFRNGAGTDGQVRDRLAAALTAGYHRTLDHLPLMQAVIARSWFQPTASDTRQRELVRPLVEVVIGVLQDGIRAGEVHQDVDLMLLGRTIWDIYISNFRYAAYDGWTIEQLTPHTRKQIDLILSSQLSRQ
jgi:AcrR family transcriptional regulator